MTEQLKRALTKRRVIFIAIAWAIALGLLFFGNLSPQQWVDFTLSVLRIVLLGV